MDHLFVQIGVMLTAGFLGGQLMRRLGQPPILGELLAGIFLGPSILGAVWRPAHAAIFGSGEACLARDSMVRFGMLLFLFTAGLEIDLDLLRRNGRTIILASLAGMAVPFGLAALSVLLLPGVWRPPVEALKPFVVFAGAALSLSALPVIVRVLRDLGLDGTRVGAVIVSSAVVSDLLGWSLFAFSLSMAAGTVRSPWLNLLLVLLAATVVVALGRRLGSGFFRWVSGVVGEAGSLIAVITVLVLAGALAAEGAGIHAVFGAFLVGVALGPTLKHTPCAGQVIKQFALSFFAPLYFVSIGLAADFGRSFDPVLTLLVITVAVAGKLAGAGLGARLGGLDLRDSLSVAVGLNARGAMELILAGVALEAGMIDSRIFVSLLTMTLFTTVLGVPLLNRLQRGRTA
jgi:Kef-type K+ transport system membrane component KefB